MTSIITRVTICRRVAEVFGYVTTPTQWPRWHASSVAVYAGPGPAGLGEQLVEEVHAAGRRERFAWTVTACDAPRRWTISGAFDRGVATISYHLEAQGDSTIFTRELQYRVQGRMLRLLNSVFLARRVARESKRALFRLKELLEPHRSTPAAEPHLLGETAGSA